MVWSATDLRLEPSKAPFVPTPSYSTPVSRQPAVSLPIYSTASSQPYPMITSPTQHAASTSTRSTQPLTGYPVSSGAPHFSPYSAPSYPVYSMVRFTRRAIRHFRPPILPTHLTR